MAVCRVILRGQQIYTVIQTVHSLLYIVAKCNFFSVVTWKDIIKYLQTCEGCTCEGCTHFCEIYVYIVCEDAVGREWIGSREQWTLCQPKHSSYIELASNELVIWIKLGGGGENYSSNLLQWFPTCSWSPPLHRLRLLCLTHLFQ